MRKKKFGKIYLKGKEIKMGNTLDNNLVSRQAVLDGLASIAKAKAKSDAQKSLMGRVMFFVEKLPPVTPQPKMGHCKDCKYFEYDSVAEVHGIPLIIAHEICKRWSDGCKTSEDGYCFLFEPQEGSDKE